MGRRPAREPGAGARREGARVDARRYHVSIKDIQAIVKPILRHRVMTNFYAASEGITRTRRRALVEAVAVPKSGM